MTTSLHGATDRRFLFLQGPHGPFFAQLSRALAAAGGTSWRVGFTGGDRLFWPDRARYIAYRGGLEDWPAALAAHLDRLGITDLVLYGEARPVHAAAIAVARARGLRLHLFEEGYLRPWWVTYEREGTTGNSPLVGLGFDEMAAALAHPAPEPVRPPDRWGDLRGHVLHGALYHGAVLLGPRPGLPPHRDIPLMREFRLHLRRLLLLPLHALRRHLATRAILRSGAPFHLALLQLEHDPTFRAHSSIGSMTGFARIVVAGFAEGAPSHHHLVFKAHPLEDGRTPLGPAIRRLAADHGIAHRVHLVPGGKLAALLDAAQSAVTVNSTAAQNALWRGIAVKCFGRAVYARPELVSDQPLPAFFAAPRRPDAEAYALFRRYLLETCQVAGGFYSAKARRRLLRRIVDLMLDPADPYRRRAADAAASRQHLRAVDASPLAS